MNKIKIIRIITIVLAFIMILVGALLYGEVENVYVFLAFVLAVVLVWAYNILYYIEKKKNDDNYKPWLLRMISKTKKTD